MGWCHRWLLRWRPIMRWPRQRFPTMLARAGLPRRSAGPATRRTGGAAAPSSLDSLAIGAPLTAAFVGVLLAEAGLAAGSGQAPGAPERRQRRRRRPAGPARRGPGATSPGGLPAAARRARQRPRRRRRPSRRRSTRWRSARPAPRRRCRRPRPAAAGGPTAPLPRSRRRSAARPARPAARASA